MTNPTPPPSLPSPAELMIDELTVALLRCHRHCDEHGDNLPDLLSAALVEIASALGGSQELTRHRPGSWEAVHVEALAAAADYRFHLSSPEMYLPENQAVAQDEGDNPCQS